MKVSGQTVAVLEDGYLLHTLMKSSVLDRDAGGNSECADQCLIVAGELGPADLVREVQISVNRCPAP